MVSLLGEAVTLGLQLLLGLALLAQPGPLLAFRLFLRLFAFWCSRASRSSLRRRLW